MNGSTELSIFFLIRIRMIREFPSEFHGKMANATNQTIFFACKYERNCIFIGNCLRNWRKKVRETKLVFAFDIYVVG